MNNQAVYIALPQPMSLLSGVAYLKHTQSTWTLHYTDDTEESATLPGVDDSEGQANPFGIISQVQAKRATPR